MEQHAIPRQVTTFEFKLIGFLTLKQFLVLAIFGLFALLFYFLFQGNIFGILLAAVVLGGGAVISLVPFQDRYLDEWARLLIKGLNSNTQYIYHKKNKMATLHYLHDLYFTEDPHRVMAHIESKEKLNAYLAAQKQQKQPNKRKEHVQMLMNSSTKQLQAKQFQPTVSAAVAAPESTAVPQAQPVPPDNQTPQTPVSTGPQTPLSRPGQTSASTQAQQMKHPFFTGIIRNNRSIPLPGILVYIKDSQDNSIRILKTNPHGVFATYSALPVGQYSVEIKDPNKNYFFDRMSINVETSNPKPFEFRSKEIL